MIWKYITWFQTAVYDPADEYLNHQDAMSHHTASPHPSLQSNTPISSPYKVLPAIESADIEKVILNPLHSIFVRTVTFVIFCIYKIIVF